MTTDLTITDPAVLDRAKELAAKAGRTDWRNWLREQALTALRGYLGLDADVTIKEAARIIGIHRNTVRNYRKAGYFPGCYQLTPNNLRIPLAEVLAVRERLERLPMRNDGRAA